MPLSALEGRGGAPHIGVAVDAMDWGAREILRAAAATGARATIFRLAGAHFDSSVPSGLRIAGFGGGAPDAVVARAIAGGTFQAVTKRLGVLHALRELGVPVWNDARAIERCIDKSATSFLLQRAGIPTPPTWAVESAAAARAIARRECKRGAMVLKPLFGSQGRGLRLIRDAGELPESEAMDGVFYLQRFVGVDRGGYRDLRVMVLRGRVLAAMSRHSKGWITNVKLGGRPEAFTPDAEIAELAIAAAGAVGADIAGVDVIHDPQGRALVLEVNSMPAWQGLQKVTAFNIADAILAALVAAARAAKP